MPRQRPSATVRHRRLAAQLRQLREAAGMTQEDVAERTGKDRSTLYRLETALQRPQRSTLIQLMDIYGVDQQRRAELLSLLKESAQRGWMQPYRSELPEVYSDYIGFEDEARSISNYESLFVPGLLQTEDYARAVIRGTLPHASPDQVENRVLARMERQAGLSRENPPRLWAIMDEAAARRQVGGPQVMAAQLARLRQAAACRT
jgi:transcriptional regulator with XRE-family HTH domain